MFKLVRDFDLSRLNTFGLPARAAAYCELTDEADLPQICALPEFDRRSVLWLGGGSNIVFGGDYAGLVVRMANKGITLLQRCGGRVWVSAKAGEVWHDFVRHCIAQGWYGLENLSLIPGTVGAAPVQNIGAYGVEAASRIDSVRCFDLETGTFVVLPCAECAFSYRESLFKQAGKGRYVIVSVTFCLSEQFEIQAQYGDLAAVLAQNCGSRVPEAGDVAEAVCQIRRSKLPDPSQLGNAGSFYKNPVVSAEQAADLQARHPEMPVYPQADGRIKLAAGWLIEQCGLKGKQIGGAAVHTRQALVLVNQGGATAADVRALSDMVRAAVAARFGVDLQPEPVWL